MDATIIIPLGIIIAVVLAILTIATEGWTMPILLLFIMIWLFSCVLLNLSKKHEISRSSGIVDLIVLKDTIILVKDGFPVKTLTETKDYLFLKDKKQIEIFETGWVNHFGETNWTKNYFFK